MAENQTQELINSINKLNRIMVKSTNLRYSFLRGLASGFGGILGATLILAIFLWGLSKLEYVPIIGSFVSQITKISGLKIIQQ